MKLVNQNERMGPWIVNANGEAIRLTKGMKLAIASTRAIVVASSPADALNAANAEAFTIGIRNATADAPAELAIYGEVGNPYEQSDAASVGQFLRMNKGKAVNVKINSPGGLAYDGITIHNALLNHDGPVTTTIEGMAGSAASIIAMAGSPARIYENAQLFIHRAALMAFGNRDMMQEAIDWLDQIDESIARTYKAKTGKALDKIQDLMKGNVDGTVFSARDAVAQKFCNEVVPLKKNGGTNAAPFEAAATGKDSQDLPPQSAQSVELIRAIRMRSRSELFVPAASMMTAPIAAKSDAEPKPEFDVGDRVQYECDGEPAVLGEVRSSMLGFTYSIKGDDGEMYGGCAEGELSVANELEADE